MKAFVILFLCLAIFGTAGYFGWELFLKPKQMLKVEKAEGGGAPPPDPSLPELEKAMKVKGGGDLIEARTALEEFLSNYPNSTKLDAAKDALGDVNIDIMFSTAPAPEKQEYVIQKGDALVKIEKKFKTTAELIMRSNNLEDPTKLQVGQRLVISQPDFTLTIDRKAREITLLNRGKFFKRYKAKTWNAPAGKATAVIPGKVMEKIAWKDNQRVAFGSKEYAGAIRWVTLSAPGYTLYSEPDDAAEAMRSMKPPAGISIAAADMEELSTLLSRGVPVSIE